MAFSFVFKRATTPGIDSNTLLCLHFDEDPFVDSSQYSQSITNNGSVARTAAASKFGGYASDWNDSDQYFTIPTITLNSDFTIDFWINPDDTQSGALGTLFMQGIHSNGGSFFEITRRDDENNLQVYLRKSGTYDVNMKAAYTRNKWTHVAVEGYNGTMYLYVDGTIGNQDTYSTANMPVGETTWIGHSNYSPAQSFYYKGQMDEFRISNVARYQGQNFTPPTSAYS